MSNITPEGMISLTIGQGFVVHGTPEAIVHAQSVLLIDSTHPVERQDNVRYFATLAETEFRKRLDLTIALAHTRGALRDVLKRLDTL